MRKGFDGLAAAVQERLAQDPFCGQLFVFRGRRGDLLKVLWWDGQGLCLFAKRLAADSDDFARSFRDDLARCSEMISLAVPT